MNPSQSPADIRQSRVKAILETCTMVAIIGAAAIVILKSLTGYFTVEAGPPGSATERKAVETIAPVVVDIGHAPTSGAATARIGIVVFSDFECPFCGVFSREVLPSLRKRYLDSGEVRIAFKQFPLTEIHPDARRVAELSACLKDHDTFWKAHDFLFQSIQALPTITSNSLASTLRIDPAALHTCATQEGKALVDADIKQGRALGLNGTPTFFLGKMKGNAVMAVLRLNGATPLPAFDNALGLSLVIASRLLDSRNDQAPAA